jgi:ABC-2 type transport system ATP-binding protein
MSGPEGGALEAVQLGRRYGARWALRDCSFTLPAGRVAALVGPNGAGKTTLLHLAVGLLRPSAGSVRVFGVAPRGRPREALPRIGFVAQDHPLYRGFTVGEMLELARRLNPRWDGALAERRLARLDIPVGQRVGRLSGGQQAQLALALALAKRPELILLDEPLASLDPLARREFLRALMEAVAEDGLTVLLSSHIIGDLERVCDYLIVLSRSRVQLAGEITAILAAHRVLVGPAVGATELARLRTVIEEQREGGRATLLVRAEGAAEEPGWEARAPSVEDMVLAYLGRRADGQDGAVAAGRAASDVEVAR